MEIIQITRKVKHMNSLEKNNIYCTCQQNNQMNAIVSDLQNPMFDIIYKHHDNKWTPHHQIALPYIQYNTHRHQISHYQFHNHHTQDTSPKHKARNNFNCYQISVLNSKIMCLHIKENTFYFQKHKQGENSIIYLNANKTHTTSIQGNKQ
jgi:hypothetical protein